MGKVIQQSMDNAIVSGWNSRWVAAAATTRSRVIGEWNRGEWTRDRGAFFGAGVLAAKQAESEANTGSFHPKASYLVKRSFSSKPASP